MKTHPDLLVRDALATLFVAAAAGNADARAQVDALRHWSEGEPVRPELRAEDGGPLFDEAGRLVPRFAALETYVRDRAGRFAAACAWLASDGDGDDPLERARAAWDAGLFFEVHEIIEPVWLEESGPRRELLQGVIMAGAALHHLTRGNLAGARGLLGEAARRLATAPAEGRLDLGGFGRGLERLRDAIEGGVIRSIADVEELPTLERTDA